MSDFDLGKITGNEPPLETESDELESLRAQLSDAKTRIGELRNALCAASYFFMNDGTPEASRAENRIDKLLGAIEQEGK